MLVVVLIIGILAAIALAQYTKTVEKARSAEAITNLKSFADAVSRYQLESGTLPSSFDDLDIAFGENCNSYGCIHGNYMYGFNVITRQLVTAYKGKAVTESTLTFSMPIAEVTIDGQSLKKGGCALYVAQYRKV